MTVDRNYRFKSSWRRGQRKALLKAQGGTGAHCAPQRIDREHDSTRHTSSLLRSAMTLRRSCSALFAIVASTPAERRSLPAGR